MDCVNLRYTSELLATMHLLKHICYVKSSFHYGASRLFETVFDGVNISQNARCNFLLSEE
jgi:hypothetical protein